MQIVIDIDENVYTRLFDNGTDFYDTDDILAMAKAIRKGTPFPKGHGRIADVDEIIKCIEDVEGEDAIWAISLIEWACTKRTIVEADKADGDDKERSDKE